MNFLVKLASAYTDDEKVVNGIVGIPNNWPIETIPYNDGDSVPTGYTVYSEQDLSDLKSNNQNSYNAWSDANQLTMIKKQKSELIRAERDRRKITCGYKVGNYWYHSDDFSRIQQIGLVMLGSNIPSGLLWKTMSGAYVTMTQTLAMQIFTAAATSDITLFTVAEQKIATMLASSDPASYDCSSGWPTGYGE